MKRYDNWNAQVNGWFKQYITAEDKSEIGKLDQRSREEKKYGKNQKVTKFIWNIVQRSVIPLMRVLERNKKENGEVIFEDKIF